jgi:biopolymer transport protein TolQ
MEKVPSLSLLSLISQADIIVQIVMLILVIASMWSWTIIFDKIIKYHILKNRSDKFEEVFEGSMMLEEIYNAAKINDNHPLSKIFIACMKEWKSSNIKQIINDAPEKKSSLKERLMSAMQVASNQSMHKLESGLSFLAIVGSAAPFVGLFGTVWGIMSSFQGIAISKNTSLAVVAPGIAEALLATAVGLFAAIPAVVAYNRFSGDVNRLAIRFESFSEEFSNVLQRQVR